MKRLVVKLILSVLLQCLLICCSLGFLLLVKESGFYDWLLTLILLMLFFIIQMAVYMVYKKPPLENDTYKGSYLVINGIFIVLETDFLFGALG